MDLLEELADRLASLFDSRSEFRWEWVAVDDGSTDGSSSKIASFFSRFENWQLVQLSRNFGQQAAYRAGLDRSRGDAVIFLDADLQDPPELMPELVARWREGFHVVVGCRKSRPERGLRGLLLRSYHHLFSLLTRNAIPKNSGTFGLMDRVVAEQLKKLPETNLFLPGLRSWVGFRREVIWYDRHARAGEARQTYSKLFNYAWEGITSFSELPLRFIFWLGILVSISGFSYAGILIAVRILQIFGFFADYVVQGFTTLAVAVICLGGIQLICIGVVGEYCGRIYREVKRRPVYIVDEASTIASK